MMIRCPECRRQMSDTALSCPNCGMPIDIVKKRIDEQKEQEHDNPEKPQLVQMKETANEKNEKQKNYGIVLLTIAGAMTAFYIFSTVPEVFHLNVTAGDVFEQIGTGIGTAIVTPHFYLVFIAFLSNIVSVICLKKGVVLFTGIMYIVSGAIFFIYAPFVIIQALLCFGAYARIKSNT